jgi:hypothetical protein
VIQIFIGSQNKEFKGGNITQLAHEILNYNITLKMARIKES